MYHNGYIQGIKVFSDLREAEKQKFNFNDFKIFYNSFSNFRKVENKKDEFSDLPKWAQRRMKILKSGNASYN